jgi:methylthioribose-1-phosphate isomerase
MTELAPMRWQDDPPALLLLDQRRLPEEEVWLTLSRASETAEAIREMAVRGAPAIGMTAAYGLALAEAAGEDPDAAEAELRASRPTAVNLAAALDRVRARQGFEGRLAEARQIEAEERAMNDAISSAGLGIVPDSARILTLCNTGAIATAGAGTALGIIRAARRDGRLQSVWACETRPRLQGLRLTAWELLREGIPFRLIADSAAAWVMARGEAELVVVGADRIAANGDTANKIGTLMLAVAARQFGVPFVVAAPSSTVDAGQADGSGFPIEERAASEILAWEGSLLGPLEAPVFNPSFDVTPAALITAIVTEAGIHRPPFAFGGGR